MTEGGRRSTNDKMTRMLGIRNLLLLSFLLPMAVSAQEAPESSRNPSRRPDQPQLFVVELTEIEHWNPDQPKETPRLDAEKLLRESRRNGSWRQRNIRRLSAVEGIECFAQFGKRVSVVVGRTISPNSTQYDYDDENVGTELRVTVTRANEDRLRVQLSFASSDVNLRSDGTKEDVEVITATSTHTMEPGIPVIVDSIRQYTRVTSGGRSEHLPHNSSLLILSVEAAAQHKTANRSIQKRDH